MKLYNYMFLKNKRISSNILSLLISIEKIQSTGYKNEDIYPQVFNKIQNISNFQSIKYSNKMDGIQVSDLLINKIVSNEIVSRNYNESLITGYVEVLDNIVNNYNQIQFNTYSIRDFHNSLFSMADYNYGGTYKIKDNIIKEKLDDGNQRVVFIPIGSESTSKAMEDLIDAFKIASDDEEIPNLLLIPCLVLDFILIYPFNDGNERLSRLLSMLLLYKNGYNVGKYVSFEKQIYNNIEPYYQAIRKSSINWDDNNNDYDSFIEIFLSCLYTSYIELNSRFKIVDGKKQNKKSRIEETIKMSFKPISRKEIHLIWPDISHETIKKVVKNLLKENKIKKIGNFKDARYKRNWYGDRSEDEENVVVF